MQEIIEDRLDYVYVNDPIPISWLKVMDELVKMSDDDPLLQLYSTNKHEEHALLDHNHRHDPDKDSLRSHSHSHFLPQHVFRRI